MADPETPPDEEPKKKSKLPMIIGLVLALAGGGGGFFAVYSGLLFGVESPEKEVKPESVEELPDIAFVEVDPLTVSLLDNGRDRHLRFRAQLETPGQYKADVEKLLPRISDVLNSYLRAVELDDLKNASALVRLRGQMLRRVQLVVGEGRVNDLLIMEFVLN
ncbi:flagellar basal body-associated protein FliL [uncultured Lentibacter sp.]|uniref:flagellar basal body-associated FliL family protein n=1 Tax=uncultured Lentibacter sp. TaxID=1659309 RepID=UPI00262B1092|nr:flagellar basal body-associated FliL family protein [uncultured Lentibacter sp.]MCW1955721.1 flagellar basal body-associated FliL family protein [Roseobacter sp.]